MTNSFDLNSAKSIHIPKTYPPTNPFGFSGRFGYAQFLDFESIKNS